jgi:feruloyl esterase
MRRLHVLAAFLGTLMACKTVSAMTCESIKSIRVGDTTITMATVVPAGGFAPRSAPDAGPTLPTRFASLPEFCRIEAIIAPTTDSHIEFQVWLPTRGWNGRYMGVGNGGGGGFINYDSENGASLAEALRNGFAASRTS